MASISMQRHPANTNVLTFYLLNWKLVCKLRVTQATFWSILSCLNLLLPWLPVLTNTEPPVLRRRAATDKLLTQWNVSCHYMTMSCIRLHFTWNPASHCGGIQKQLMSQADGGTTGTSSPQSNCLVATFTSASGHCWIVLERVRATAMCAARNGVSPTTNYVTVVKPKQCHISSTLVHWPSSTADYCVYMKQMRRPSTGWQHMAPSIWQRQLLGWEAGMEEMDGWMDKQRDGHVIMYLSANYNMTVLC